jgi:hypothetical protein
MPYIGNITSDFSINTGNITNRAVTATKLSPSSVGSNGQVLSVDGSGNLQWSADASGTALTGSTNNTITTVTGANAIQGEANLTYDGNNLSIATNAATEGIRLTSTGNTYNSIIATANRTNGLDNLLEIRGQWNTNNVCSINLLAGLDTTNKDDGQICFYTSEASSTLVGRLRITNTGKILVNHHTPVPISASTNFNLQVIGTDFETSGIACHRFDTSTSGGSLILSHSKNGTKGSHTILVNGDELGKIRFYGSDGTDFTCQGAEVSSRVDGTPSENNIPARLAFYTTQVEAGVTDPTERLRITSGGQVQIRTHGSNVSGAPLYLATLGKSTVDYGGGTDDTACLRIVDCGTNNNYYHGIELRAKQGGDVRLYAYDAGADQGAFVIATDNNGLGERLRVQHDGMVGIGTTDPDQILHVATTGACKFRLEDKRTSIADGSQYAVIQFEHQDANTPGVAGEIAAVMTDTTNGATALQFTVGTPSTKVERMRIDSNGDVGIGIVDPITPLHVKVTGVSSSNWGGGTPNTSVLRVEDKGDTNGYYHGIEIRSKRSGDSRLLNYDRADNLADFLIMTDNGGTIRESFRVEAEGHCSLPDGNLKFASGHGIDFSATANGSGASNVSELLDDYEEGTFTPTLLGGGSETGITYGARGGTYTKIGRQVTINLGIELSSRGGNTNNQLDIGGLPFTVGDNLAMTSHEANGSAHYWQNFSQNMVNVGITADDGTTNVFVMGTESNGNTGNTHIYRTQIADNWSFRASITYFIA